MAMRERDACWSSGILELIKAKEREAEVERSVILNQFVIIGVS